MDSQDYNEAAEHFSAVLLLDPGDRIEVLIKRNKARASMNAWKDALSDADEVCSVHLRVSGRISNRARRSSNSTHHVIEATR